MCIICFNISIHSWEIILIFVVPVTREVFKSTLFRAIVMYNIDITGISNIMNITIDWQVRLIRLQTDNFRFRN